MNPEAEFVLILGYLRLFWKVLGIKKLNYSTNPPLAGREKVSNTLNGDF